MMQATPDLILHNGRFHTLDKKYPFATAVAVAGKKISALGNDKEILSLAGPYTKKVDLEKKLVLPGFIDTHFHFYEWALNYESIDFSKTLSFAEMEADIHARAAELEQGQWVLGQGFNESDWPENKMPDRKDLDRVALNNPVCIWRCDLHLAVANSLALKLAGIDQNTKDSDGEVIVRDGAGFPTGVLKEMAPDLIRKVIPELPESRLLENMEKTISLAHGLGLTSIHDIRLMGGKEGAQSLKTWQTLHGAGKLKLRCHVSLPGEMTDQAIALGLQSGFGDDLLRIGYLKFFADGGMGARTAWMTEKYLDADYGMPLTPVEEIETAVMKADAAGLSCMVHAIGDRACKQIINLFLRVEQRNQSRCRLPHRMEHVQMILPEDLENLGKLKNLAVSCQPNNLSLDISMIDQCAGSRGLYAYNLKGILNTGIPLMLSSDAPVADPNPFAGIYSAVTRKRMNKTPEQGWYMEQALGVEEAVKGYTLTPAQVSGCGHILGSLAPGKLADMVVADQNIFEILPDEIAGTQVDMTIFNGKIVYER
jgi:predicted amidohydrolase YtcJ